MSAVTVVIATHNRAAALRSAIDSARQQTLAEIEIVVVDNGSTDATAELCAAIAREDPRVRTIRSGATDRSSARNLGLAAARGEWVAFLDDDDLLHREFAERMLATVSGRASMGCCEALLFDAPVDLPLTPDDVLRDAAGTLRPRRLIPGGLPERIGLGDLLLASLFPLNAVLVERGCLQRLGGFREGLEFGEDVELWLRLAGAFGPLPVLHEPLALVRCHDRQSSRDLGRMAASTIEILREAWAREHGPSPLPMVLRRRLAFLERDRAYAALLAGQAAAARRAAWASIVLWPLSWKSWAYLAVAPAPHLHAAIRRRLGRAPARRP